MMEPKLSSEALWSRVRSLEGQTVYTLKIRKPNVIKKVTEDRVIIRDRRSTPTREQVETVYNHVWKEGVFRVHEGNWSGPANVILGVVPAIVLAAVPEQIQLIPDQGLAGIERKGNAKGAQVRILRMFTGPDGKSHFGEVELSEGAFGPVVKQVLLPAMDSPFLRVGSNPTMDRWHTAPRRQYLVMLKGRLEIEVSGGEKRVFGPGDILLAEDETGQGHRGRDLDSEARVCLFLPVKAD